MTIYIKNNTSTDFTYPVNGRSFTFKAGYVSYLDETLLSYNLLSTAFGTSNLQLLTSPLQTDIDNSIAALVGNVSGVSAELLSIINSTATGNKYTKQLDSLLGIQVIKDALRGIFGTPADSANTDSTSTTASLFANIKGILTSVFNAIGTSADTSSSNTLRGDVKKLAEKIVERPLAWDDTTTSNVIYLKYSTYIEKIDNTTKTITSNIGGVWADRASLTYTESGV